MVVPMNYNSSGGDDFDCSLNPTGDCTINVTAYAFMWDDRKDTLTSAANWNPPLTCAALARAHSAAARHLTDMSNTCCRYQMSRVQTQQQQLLGYM